MGRISILSGLVAVLALAVPVHADDVYWKPTTPPVTGDWHVDSNWVGGVRPGTGDDVKLYQPVPLPTGGACVGTAEVSAASGDVRVRSIDIGGYYNGENNVVHLLVSGGTLTIDHIPYSYSCEMGDTWDIWAHPPTPTIRQTGGTVKFNGWVKMSLGQATWAGGNSQYIISGGSLHIDYLRIYSGCRDDRGYGRFKIDCSPSGPGGPSSITVGTWNQTALGTENHLSVVLNSNGDISTPINVTGSATLQGALDVDDRYYAIPTIGHTVDVLIAGGVYSESLTVTNSNWEIDATAPTGTLRIKCLVPEPTTPALLGLGGLGLLLRRRLNAAEGDR